MAIVCTCLLSYDVEHTFLSGCFRTRHPTRWCVHANDNVTLVPLHDGISEGKGCLVRVAPMPVNAALENVFGTIGKATHPLKTILSSN